METTKILRFTAANFSYFPFHITFIEKMPVEENALKFLWLPFYIQISCNPHIN